MNDAHFRGENEHLFSRADVLPKTLSALDFRSSRLRVRDFLIEQH